MYCNLLPYDIFLVLQSYLALSCPAFSCLAISRPAFLYPAVSFPVILSFSCFAIAFHVIWFVNFMSCNFLLIIFRQTGQFSFQKYNVSSESLYAAVYFQFCFRTVEDSRHKESRSLELWRLCALMCALPLDMSTGWVACRLCQSRNCSSSARMSTGQIDVKTFLN